MSTSELTTLVIAVAALIASLVSIWEMVRQRGEMTRQRKNEIRPLLAVIETRSKDERAAQGALAVYLVNMGTGPAIRVRAEVGGQDIELNDSSQDTIAAGRRLHMIEGHTFPLLAVIELDATYEDLDGKVFNTSLRNGSHEYRERYTMDLSVGLGIHVRPAISISGRSFDHPHVE